MLRVRLLRLPRGPGGFRRHLCALREPPVSRLTRLLHRCSRLRPPSPPRTTSMVDGFMGCAGCGFFGSLQPDMKLSSCACGDLLFPSSSFVFALSYLRFKRNTKRDFISNNAVIREILHQWFNSVQPLETI